MATDIDPRILAKRTHLAQLRRQSAQMGLPPDDEIEHLTTPQLTGMPPEPVRMTAGLPELRGSPAQIKWAVTIRENALKLRWGPEVAAMLVSITDATWWIANKSIVNTMKFKEPAPQQMDGSAPTPPSTAGRTPAAGVSTPAATPLADAFAANAQRAQTTRAANERFTEAEQWAESVCHNPMLAKAAILAVLSKLYKDGEIKERMRRASRVALAQAENAIDKDVDAINRMLA